MAPSHRIHGRGLYTADSHEQLNKKDENLIPGISGDSIPERVNKLSDLMVLALGVLRCLPG